MRTLLLIGSLVASCLGWFRWTSGPILTGFSDRNTMVTEMVSEPVFVTQYGEKFHYCTCRMVENPFKAFPSAAKARLAGYSSCHFCADMIGQDYSPCPDRHQAILRGEAPANTPTPSSRCRANTQKGTQCLRKNNEVSNYCWQHSR